MNHKCKVLMLGGTGILGDELRDFLVFERDACTISPCLDKTATLETDEHLIEFAGKRAADVLHREQVVELLPKDTEGGLVIINAAAETKVLRDSVHDGVEYGVNVRGPQNVVAAAQAVAPHARHILISSDYCYGGAVGAYAEVGWSKEWQYTTEYARTKVAGEVGFERVATACGVYSFCTIRTSFFPRWDNWPWPVAFWDQITSRDRVDKVAPEIWAACLSSRHRRLNVTTGKRWTVLQMAQHYYGTGVHSGSRVNVLPSSPDSLPADTSLNAGCWASEKKCRDLT